MAMMSFTVNNKAVSVDVEPDTPLLWVVREHLKLTGTKFGCGSGLCGACTVHINGKAVRSCQAQMSESRASASPRSKGCQSTAAIRCRELGSPSRCRSAATASPARSCRPPSCSRKLERQRANRSSPTWTAISAAAEPIRASFAPSNALRRRAEP